MADQNEEMKDTVWRENLGQKIVVVFSCPGQDEMYAGRPVVGKTGDNLNYMLSLLTFEGKSLSRDKVSITNAWPNIEFNALTGRTEAKDCEILNVANLNRLDKEIGKETEIIIAFGDKAGIAVGQIVESKSNLLVVCVPHLSLRYLNSNISKDTNGNDIMSLPEEKRNFARLEVVANKIKIQSKGKLT